ncbi:MAG: flotillin-like FloA family protein [Planctomycetota bacterium]
MDTTPLAFVPVVLALIALMFFTSLALVVWVIKPWLRAFMHGVPVSLFHILGMRLRGNPPTILIDAYIKLHRAGDEVTLAELEHTYIDSRSRILSDLDLVEVFESRFRRSPRI